MADDFIKGAGTLTALRRLPSTLVGNFQPPPSGLDALSPEDLARIGELGGRIGSAGGDVASQLSSILGRAATERIQSQIPEWLRQLNEDPLRALKARAAFGPPGTPAGAVQTPVDAPTASGVPGAPPTPGSAASAPGRGPVVDALTIAHGLTPPEFEEPDFSKMEAILAELGPGEVPVEPTGREELVSILSGAAIGAAQGRDAEQSIALAVAGALQGKAQEEREFVRRAERFEERDAELKIKRLEIENQMEVQRRNFELQRQAAQQDFQQFEANFNLNRKQLEINRSIEMFKLAQPHIGIANNRLIITPRDGRGEPKSFVINEMADIIAQAEHQANIAKALGSPENSVTLGNEMMKTTIKDPAVANALSYGHVQALERANDPEIIEQKERIRQRLFAENPAMQQLRPEQIEAQIIAELAVQLGIGAIGNVSSGREVPLLNPVPLETVPQPDTFGRGALRGVPGIGIPLDRILHPALEK